MATKMIMPVLGESVEEATITRWLKTEGDSVEEYEALVEVNTDKVDTEIPAPVSGTLLKIVIPEEGTTVEVGMVLAWIGEPGEAIPEADSAPEAAVQPEIEADPVTPMAAAAPTTGPPVTRLEAARDFQAMIAGAVFRTTM